MPHVTTCKTCGKAYEEFSEEAANSQDRECVKAKRLMGDER